MNLEEFIGLDEMCKSRLLEVLWFSGNCRPYACNPLRFVFNLVHVSYAVFMLSE